jgi:ACS family hexuronate transporter-like MFS transporter
MGEPVMSPPAARSAAWRWWVCILLLLATMINYMDRLTINSTADRILNELHLTEADYGKLEFAFGIAFAMGSLGTGWLVDRYNVRWMYPTVVLGWSAAGFATGWATNFSELALCRFCLGLFEGGNWTCALRTTQRILSADRRTAGNSILQSGAALGAIVTPQIVRAFVNGPGSWRYPFFVIGAAGCSWIVFWLLTVSSEDLALVHRQVKSAEPSEPDRVTRHQTLSSVFLQPRFLVLLVVVICINLTWHFFRAWLPLYLQRDRAYLEGDVLQFTSLYYIAADIGSLSAGFATLGLTRGGIGVHRARVTVYAVAAMLTTLSIVIAIMPTGPLLLVLLLVLAFAALALFPSYYSFSQELTTQHQGKLTGVLGCATWLSAATMHLTVGTWIKETGAYGPAVAVAGLLPMIGLAALLTLWRRPHADRAGEPRVPMMPRDERVHHTVLSKSSSPDRRGYPDRLLWASIQSVQHATHFSTLFRRRAEENPVCIRIC